MAKTTTIKGTSEEIGVLVLRWADLDELWDEEGLGWDYNPTTDVVEWSDGTGLDVSSSNWDADRPMYSEIDYTVKIRDPEVAKAGLLKRIEELISHRDKARR